MLGCRMAMSSKGVTQRLEMSVNRLLLAGMVARWFDDADHYQWLVGIWLGDLAVGRWNRDSR